MGIDALDMSGQKCLADSGAVMCPEKRAFLEENW